MHIFYKLCVFHKLKCYSSGGQEHFANPMAKKLFSMPNVILLMHFLLLVPWDGTRRVRHWRVGCGL